MLLSAAAEIWVALEWPIRLLWCATTAGFAGLAVFISSTCIAGGRSKYMKVHNAHSKKGTFDFYFGHNWRRFRPRPGTPIPPALTGKCFGAAATELIGALRKRSTICAGLSNSLRFLLFLRVGRTGLNKCTNNVRIAISARSTDEKAIIGWQVTDPTLQNLQNKYSKSLLWAWNLNNLLTVIGGKFKFQVQDSDMESKSLYRSHVGRCL